jgi:RNA polymerase sigma-70 factor (ECF subfamily)
MIDTEWSSLRSALIGSYDELVRRLTRRLKSADLARDALQNTYLRIERGGEIGPVDYPFGYVLQIATNLGLAQRRAEQRFLTGEEVEAALDVADDGPSPSQTAEAKSSLALLERTLERLPARRRAIFLAVWREHLPPADIAARYGLSVRKIYLELKSAREFCIDAMGELPKK